MKKVLSTLIILIAILCSQVLVFASTPSGTTPNIRLPVGLVTINAKYSTNTWFDMKLSDVPDGFDIINGSYNGWCIQKDIYMTKGVNHAVMLYSSYDPDITNEYKYNNWDKINYVINHKIGNSESIEKAIWYFIDLGSYPSDTDAQTMITEADLNGVGFIPRPGELVAILVVGVPTIQRTFLELVVPIPASLGDFVWNDINHNGIQDKGEPGLPNIEVRLLDEKQTIIDITHTNNKGYYTFNYVDTGNYFIQFILPNGYKFTLKDVGTNDALDSDAYSSNGKTDLFTVNAHISDTSRDAGMFKVNGETGISGRKNHAPTADATAGEPYNGFTGEEITFNGSKSYDRDGYIVNWTWDFGDGTKGYGECIDHIYSYDRKYLVILTVKDNDNAYDSYATYANILIGNYPPSEPIIKGPIFGHKNTNYSFTIVASDPDNDEIRYIINWGDKESIVTQSEFLPSGMFFSTIKSWSEAGKYVLTVKASDNKTESNSEMTICIDAKDVKNIGYITDDNGDGIYDSFHQNKTGLITKLKLLPNGNYLIDYNGDGKFDYEYNLFTDKLNDYVPNEIGQNNFILIIVAIVGLLLVFIIFKRKRNKKEKINN